MISTTRFFLLICLAISVYLLYNVFRPFLIDITLSIILAIVTFPIFKLFLKWFRNRRAIASLMSCLVILLLFIIPLFFTILVFIEKAVDTYQIVNTQLQTGEYDEYLRSDYLLETLSGIMEDIPYIDEAGLESLEFDLKEQISAAISSIGSFLISLSTRLASNLGILILDFILIIFTLFFIYKDGEKLLRYFLHLSPLSSTDENKLVDKFTSASKSIMMGVVLTPLIHGIVLGGGFAIAGISPFFWGIIITISSVIPLVGNGIVWVPYSIFLMITGEIGYGLFLLIYCLAFSILIDNVVRPYLVRGKSDYSPILIFFSILGGIAFFGVSGLILGPIILIITVTFLDIYEMEYREHLNKMDDV